MPRFDLAFLDQPCPVGMEEGIILLLLTRVLTHEPRLTMCCISHRVQRAGRLGVDGLAKHSARRFQERLA